MVHLYPIDCLQLLKHTLKHISDNIILILNKHIVFFNGFSSIFWSGGKICLNLQALKCRKIWNLKIVYIFINLLETKIEMREELKIKKIICFT